MEDLDISELDSLDKMDVAMIFNQYLYALITNLNTLVKDEDILYFETRRFFMY
jgi:calcineurin-like phosphoesterase family protein